MKFGHSLLGFALIALPSVALGLENNPLNEFAGRYVTVSTTRYNGEEKTVSNVKTLVEIKAYQDSNVAYGKITVFSQFSEVIDLIRPSNIKLTMSKIVDTRDSFGLSRHSDRLLFTHLRAESLPIDQGGNILSNESKTTLLLRLENGKVRLRSFALRQNTDGAVKMIEIVRDMVPERKVVAPD